MALSNEMRRLKVKWEANTGWPQRLEWLRINGLRGWTGQRVSFDFPIVAIVGENGVGKSSILQAAAAIYREKDPDKKKRFAYLFFPDTPWEKMSDAEIAYSVRRGDGSFGNTIRKPTDRWRGNPTRPERFVEYIDLRRVQPVLARTGFMRLAKPVHKEISAQEFEKLRLGRLSRVMARDYDLAKMATTDADTKRPIPVVGVEGTTYSGFHQGAGETTVLEFLSVDPGRYALLLIDEIETSLHPRAQRRLIRDLAERCRENELQIILTTHSPYVLEELPLEARICIIEEQGVRSVVTGVSPEFAMSQMDDQPHHECDLYVEDRRAAEMITEILISVSEEIVTRCRIIPYGAASVGQALGQMVSKGRFPDPTRVFLDGDQAHAPGCMLLPGDDAPERVVFEGLKGKNWCQVATRVGRPFGRVADKCSEAMLSADHHGWVETAASSLVLGGDILWHAMCAEWASECLDPSDAQKIVQSVQDAIAGIPFEEEVSAMTPEGETTQPPVEPAPDRKRRRPKETARGQASLFGNGENTHE